MECYTNQDFNNYTNTLTSLDCLFNYNDLYIPSPNNLSIEDYSLTINNDDQNLMNNSAILIGEEFSPDFNTFPASCNYTLHDDHYNSYYSMSSVLEADELNNNSPSLLGNVGVQNLTNSNSGPTYCKLEEPSYIMQEMMMMLPTDDDFNNMGLLFPEDDDEKKINSKVKNKINGRPSKNLMAERRRRKRLNDRLSMLRSVVPKISKMDRTSILGDTIDYMKELLERINHLQEKINVGSSSDQLSLMSIFKDVKPNEVLVRNSPKFDVERREEDTRIEICCAARPGLLLSTVTTLEALGLEIQHCVISCFNDFAMQASCSEEMKQRAIMDSEDMKQALFRNAGYGGRCL